MPHYRIERGARPPSSATTRIALIVAVIVVLLGARSIASYVIEVEWWKELGQLHTFFSTLYYSLAPLGLATLITFAVLFVAHSRALKFAGASLRDHRGYARLAALGLLFLAYIVSASSIDTWTVVRFAGGQHLPASATVWHDAVFHKPLSFYLFDLPFYSMLRSYLLALVIVAILVYWVVARGWQLRVRLPQFRDSREIDPTIFRLEGGLESQFLRGAGVVLLLALALRFFLARFEMVYNEHGTFLVGVDYVDQYIGLPLQWLVIAACIAAAVLVWMRRWVLAAFMGVALIVAFVLPPIVSALYVKPNEISLERPYIDTHIHSTRSAFGLEQQVKEIDFHADPDGVIDVSQHRPLLDNVRLWDFQPYHDTITQRQALRTYYVFHDSDVDRYTIDGQYKQVLLSPRELDIRQLPDARANWINPAFIYTHGYGLVLSEVSKMTSDGLPVLSIKDAPPVVETPSLKLTRPEIYYGEVTHEPVFVHTAQQEFNYPSGEDNVRSTYEGTGGIPISSFLMRLAAAVREGEPNILLTDYLKANSRMMIRRRVRDRLQTLAGFLEWDTDPYMVITDAGRLVWIVDGYTTSDAHPYSRAVDTDTMGRVNYIRNAVKATVDAYDGETHLYVFAPDDPIINAYQNLFPDLFKPESAMPADLRRHARYPEMLFRIQSQIYLTYHMLDPQSFYNKEDVWDLALHAGGQEAGSSAVTPSYVMATLPGETGPEFLQIIPFTPHNKNNLIGLMAARCDGAHLGEVQVLLLSKQKLIPGPMNISATINQDQNISKDLTLWNQQGSHVLRGQILVLPVGNTFLYVDPIYIQASEGSMPQLKKIVLATGNRLIYADTYDEALAQLSNGARELVQQATSASAAPPAAGPAGAPAPAANNGAADARLARVRDHLQRYRQLAAQGKWADAGKELEAIEAEVKK
ncbi:MAG TPA: UPF0182 family protein [Candidatus Limnocylindrales bacterium]|nr:UPF0182 family protein [Candidatus Limnocylindrales bacterium]